MSTFLCPFVVTHSSTCPFSSLITSSSPSTAPSLRSIRTEPHKTTQQTTPTLENPKTNKNTDLPSSFHLPNPPHHHPRLRPSNLPLQPHRHPRRSQPLPAPDQHGGHLLHPRRLMVQNLLRHHRPPHLPRQLDPPFSLDHHAHRQPVLGCRRSINMGPMLTHPQNLATCFGWALHEETHPDPLQHVYCRLFRGDGYCVGCFAVEDHLDPDHEQKRKIRCAGGHVHGRFCWSHQHCESVGVTGYCQREEFHVCKHESGYFGHCGKRDNDYGGEYTDSESAVEGT